MLFLYCTSRANFQRSRPLAVTLQGIVTTRFPKRWRTGFVPWLTRTPNKRLRLTEANAKQIKFLITYGRLLKVTVDPIGMYVVTDIHDNLFARILTYEKLVRYVLAYYQPAFKNHAKRKAAQPRSRS